MVTESINYKMYSCFNALWKYFHFSLSKSIIKIFAWTYRAHLKINDYISFVCFSTFYYFPKFFYLQNFTNFWTSYIFKKVRRHVHLVKRLLKFLLATKLVNISAWKQIKLPHEDKNYFVLHLFLWCRYFSPSALHAYVHNRSRGRSQMNNE